MTLYELWEDDEGCAFFPADHPQKDMLLGPNPKLTWSVEANDWEDAMQKKCEHVGETYRPLQR